MKDKKQGSIEQKIREKRKRDGEMDKKYAEMKQKKKRRQNE